MSARWDDYQESQDLWKLMAEFVLTENPEAVDLWERTFSPLRGGAISKRSKAKLSNMLALRAAAHDALNANPGNSPSQQVDPQFEIKLGHLSFDYRFFNRHFLISGPSGCAKTTSGTHIVRKICQKASYMRFVFYDHQGYEGRRIEGGIVFNIQSLPWHILHPVGNSATYYNCLWSEFAQAYQLRTETWTEPPEIFLRIEKGLTPGEPYPSMYDARRLLKILAKQERRPKLETVSQAIGSYIASAGESAFIRKGVVIEDRCPRFAIDLHSLPFRVDRFVAGVSLLRRGSQKLVEGHQSFSSLAPISVGSATRLKGRSGLELAATLQWSGVTSLRFP